MKHLKRILVIILIIFIVFLLYDIYLKLKEDNINIDFSMFLGTYNSIINVSMPDDENINTSIINSNNASTNLQNIPSNHFYYNQLDNNGKIIYNALEENIPNLKLTNYKINFSKQFNTLLHQSNGSKMLEKGFQSAIDAFSYDHPELFYIDISKIMLHTTSKSFGSITTYDVFISPKDNTNYLYSEFYPEEKLEKSINQVNKIRDSFINGATGNNYNKVLQVHDTLINMIEYDTSYSKNNTYNIYGALIENSVVCEGYAKAFKYILDALDIPCILVSGTGTNSNGDTEAHMWNYVQINNSWYGVDVTWDDPIIVGGFIKNTINHNYFCKGSNTFNSSHIISNKISSDGIEFSYPELSINDYKK